MLLTCKKRRPRLWILVKQARRLGCQARDHSRHCAHPRILNAPSCPLSNWITCVVWGSRNTAESPTAIHRAQRVLGFGLITPAHRKPPWAGYQQSLRLFTKLLAAHPLAGICRPRNLSAAESIKHAEQVGTVLSIRGHSAGSYAGMVWEGILAKFPNIEGTTVLAAIALPPSFLTQPTRSAQRQLHLIHHAWVCVWTPSKPDLHLLKQQGLKITLSASLVGEHTWAARSIIIHTGRRWNSLRDDMTLRPLNKYPVSCLVKYMHKAL